MNGIRSAPKLDYSLISTYIRTLHFGYELIVPSRYAFGFGLGTVSSLAKSKCTLGAETFGSRKFREKKKPRN